MRVSFLRPFLAVFFLLFSQAVWAETNAQVLVVPKCLLGMGFNYDELAAARDIRLIKTTQLKRLQAVSTKKPRRCRGFINVTHAWQRYSTQFKVNPTLFLRRYLPDTELTDLMRGYKIQYQSQIQSLFQEIDADLLEANLQDFTQFPDRDADSKSGLLAANWIEQQLKAMVKISARHDVEIYRVSTLDVDQPSIVLKIGDTTTAPAIVLGAPMDTLAAYFNNKKPGADDSASGVTTLLEAARVILNSQVKLRKPLYFVWYGAKASGKLGSQSVVKHFNQNSIAVDAVLNMDMTGYQNKNEAGIGLVDEATDVGLTAFTADLIGAYVKQPAGVVRCGYACSDHISWSLNGNRVVYPFETMDDEGNPHAQTRSDTVNRLSIDHMLSFVKLSIAFAVELGEIEKQ